MTSGTSLTDVPVRLDDEGGDLTRIGAVALAIVEAPDRSAAVAEEITALCRGVESEPTPGRALARRLAGVLAAAAPEDVPDFCVLADAETGIQVIVHGPVDIVVRRPEGETRITGTGVATWVDRLLDPPIDELVVSRSSGVDGPAPPGAPTFSTLTLGTAEPTASPAPLPLETGGGKDDDRAVGDAATLAPTTPTGPAMVQGVRCQNGHFNRPTVLYCSTCGISTVHTTLRIVEGPRPALGILVLDDGSTYVLDTGYVVGRDPGDDPAVTSGTARPLLLDDGDRSVSRVHAEIRLDGWDVTVVDRGGGNGTHVCPAGATEWTRLTANKPATIEPGSHVLFGRRSCLFDSSR